MPSDLSHGPDLDDGEYGDLIVQNSISIREIAGREGTDTINGGTASVTWLVKGSADPADCRSALFAAEAASLLDVSTYDGLYLNSLDRRRRGPTSWEFTAGYDGLTPTVGSYTVSIDTTGAAILQTAALSETRFPVTGKTLPNYLGSIDVQDGQPQGVERIIPALKISIRSKIATEYVESPARYSKLIAELTGTTNNATVFSDDEGAVFQAGELLFAGATGEVVAENPMLTFTFIASKNLTSVTLGDITGVNKKGHEYLWYLFDYDKDATTGLLISKPRGCYVNKIYGEADHSLLKIGVDAT
jgi:hypothetical protein